MNYRQKILIFSHEFPPRLGGIGTFAQDLAQNFSDIGHEVTVITQKNSDRKKNTSYKIIELNTHGKFWFVTYPLYFLFHRKDQYDHIILNDGVAIYSAGLTFSKSSLSKSTVYIHGIERYLSGNTIPLKVLRFRSFFAKALLGAGQIIAVSNYIKDIFFSDFLNTNYHKCRVVTNGVNKNIFFYEASNILDVYRTNRDTKILLTVSRIVEGKGFDRKLLLFEQLVNKGRNVSWVIVGDGPYLSSFREKVRNSAAKESIYFVGKRHRHDLRYFYSSADVFWLLSELKESFGLVYLEAMACGCIPVGNANAGVKEAINHGVNGILMEKSDDIVNVLDFQISQIDAKKLPDLVKSSYLVCDEILSGKG